MKAGIGKADITAFKKGIGMLGYGHPHNNMQTILTRLYSRALVLKSDNGSKLAFVNTELAFVTTAIVRAVRVALKEKSKLGGYTHAQLLISAQHTHSAPGGFSQYPFYNISSPGYHQDIFDKIVEGIVESVLIAESNIEEVKFSYASGEVPIHKEVAFNRSFHAYSKNPDAKKLTADELHLAVNRNMDLFRITDRSGNTKAVINWFGVHTTSLSNDNTRVCSDNKGYAAAALEKKLNSNNAEQDAIAIFAQGICGDVTPKFNFRSSRKAATGKFDGKFRDEVESSQYNGQLQCDQAETLLQSTELEQNLDEHLQIDSVLRYFDFSCQIANSVFTGGTENLGTSPACMGMRFFEGSPIDGPGAPKIVGNLARRLCRRTKRRELNRVKSMGSEEAKQVLWKYDVQGAKDIFMETGIGRVLGMSDLKGLPIPGFVDPTIALFKYFANKGTFDILPWTPHILPIQLVRFGKVVLVSFPFEITTISGERLLASMKEKFENTFVEKVVLCPYANGYSGYITTPEEYQVQAYEGGHTVFGRWSLPVLQTLFDQLADELLKPQDQRSSEIGPLPPELSPEQLDLLKYHG